MKIIYLTYFVHGTTTDNEKGLATGWLPGELSRLGIKQAKKLGILVSNKKFDVIFCSDLKRAVDSAKFGFGGKCKIIQDKRLRECNYGDLTEKPVKDFKNNLNNYLQNPFPNGESYKEVEKRIANFLDMLKKKYCEKKIAIVSHQGPQLALDVLIKGRSWEQVIDKDWRKKKSWQPGWEYKLKC